MKSAALQTSIFLDCAIHPFPTKYLSRKTLLNKSGETVFLEGQEPRTDLLPHRNVTKVQFTLGAKYCPFVILTNKRFHS